MFARGKFRDDPPCSACIWIWDETTDEHTIPSRTMAALVSSPGGFERQ